MKHSQKSKKTVKSVAGLLLVKRHSNRLPNKNILPIGDTPMYEINLKKCLSIFDRVYVSTDDYEIYKRASILGALSIQRGEDLTGDTPNIGVYRHAIKQMDCDAFVAVQANSPTIDEKIIRSCKSILLSGIQEVMTCFSDGSVYGSCWGMTKSRLDKYIDPYHPTPEILLLDKSIDVHTKQDYNLVVNQLSNG